jgi:iron transport multicopper oxidase
MGQYPDGMRGALIVDDPEDPFAELYDEEIIITVSDWYFDDSITIVKSLLSPGAPERQLPIPDVAFLNDDQPSDYDFDPTKTYRIRFISFAALGSFMIEAQNTPMTVIMNDAIYVDMPVVRQLHLTPGQRYDVLVRGNRLNARGFPILFAADANPDYSLLGPGNTGDWPFNVTANFVVDGVEPRAVADVDLWTPEDSTRWMPFFLTPQLPEPDIEVTYSFVTCRDEYNIAR